MRVSSLPLLALALVLAGCEGPAAPPPRAGAPAAPAVASPPDRATAEPARTTASIGFRSSRALAEHFAKHGAEFGAASAGEYLARAQALRDRRAGGDVLEIVRDDGVITRFDRASGAFIAFERDGVIRTFFIPNDGERYFQRQATRQRR